MEVFWYNELSMENSFKNQIEENKPTTGVFTKRELIDHIYQGDSLPKNKKFLRTDEGGVFKYFDLELAIGFSLKDVEKVFPYIKIGNEIVGLAQLHQSEKGSKKYWVSFVSVDPKFQEKGYASKLIEEIMKYAKSRNITLETSSYKEIGFERLRNVLHREAEKYGVVLHDEENKMY